MTDAENAGDASADVAAPDSPAQTVAVAPAQAPAPATTQGDATTVEVAPAAETPADSADPYAALVLAEDSAVSAEALAGLKTFAAEHKLAPEVAAALLAREEGRVEVYEAMVGKFTEGLATTYGDKIDTARAQFDAGVAWACKPGTPAEGLLQTLKDIGAADWPPLFDVFRAIGESVTEPGRLVNGKSQQNAMPLNDDQEWNAYFPNSGKRPSAAVSASRMAT